MQPITLRIQSDLLSELESEADEHGYSSRAEYIRQLLLHRTNAKAAISMSDTDSVADSEIVNDNSERIDTISEKVDQLSNRVETLEEQVKKSPAESKPNGQVDKKEATKQVTTSIEQATDTAVLESWLQENGPKSTTAQEIIVEAAELLLESGPLSAGELKSKLYDSHPEAYSSENTLWGSTISRVYEEAPGFSKPDRGIYDYDMD